MKEVDHLFLSFMFITKQVRRLVLLLQDELDSQEFLKCFLLSLHQFSFISKGLGTLFVVSIKLLNQTELKIKRLHGINKKAILKNKAFIL